MASNNLYYMLISFFIIKLQRYANHDEDVAIVIGSSSIQIFNLIKLYQYIHFEGFIESTDDLKHTLLSS